MVYTNHYTHRTLTIATLDKLQHVQNAAAHLVTGTRKYEQGLS